MRIKCSVLSALLVLCFLWQSAQAAERNFPAGSLIIPMDSYYQSDDDGGILEAYGLVYYLLSYLAGEQAITVYWVINHEKAAIDDPDCIIEDLTLEPGEKAVELYDHNGGTTTLTATRPGDNANKITYSGAPWIVDAADVAKAKLIIDKAEWAAVEVHVAQVPFKANVDKELRGTPPQIALMDSSENGGNAKILQSYLRLAGICNDVYEVLTPDEVRDGLLILGDYDFLWAPHWHGHEGDQNDNGIPDRQDVVDQVKLFLESGNGLLAECACIREFEELGRFLTSDGFEYNGGSNRTEDVIYNATAVPYSQIGNYEYEPTGGSIHNWRAVGGSSNYNDTVTRFTIDDTGWDYYVGGYAYGDRKNGYAVYLGGHSYASCGSLPDPDAEPNITRLDFEFQEALFGDSVDLSTHSLNFEFEEDVSNEIFTLLVQHSGGLQTTVNFSRDDLTAQAGDSMEINLTTAEVNGKKIETVIFKNNASSSITIDAVTLSWSGGHRDQLLRKIIDKTTGAKLYDQPIVGPGVELPMSDFSLDPAAGGDQYTILVKYNGDSSTEISFDSTSTGAKIGEPLEIDLTEAYVDSNKLRSVVLKNVGLDTVTVDTITVFWNSAPDAQTINRISDLKTGDKIYDQPKVGSGVELTLLETIELQSLFPEIPSGCVENDDCSWKNIAAVRYVLNTLFNIKFDIQSREYVRAPPIINHPYLYQGSFEWPNLRGHFRCFDVTASAANRKAEWDTADGGIKNAADANLNPKSRKIYTAKKNADGTWSKIDFDADNLAELCNPLNVTPADCYDGDEGDVINRVRGRFWNRRTLQWVEQKNKLGAIMHSAPVIIGDKSRVSGSRSEIAFVGSLDGMLHAVATASGDEKWAFIPRNLLEKLKNDRTDPNATRDFAAVDASPAAKDVYYDHDDDGDQEWRTVLVSAEGQGGNSIFALDVTDPDAWSVLWETTDTAAPGGGMGHAYRVAIGKVKWPVQEVDDENGNGIEHEIIGYEIKWVVFLSTGYSEIAASHGGIHVFAFDLKTGAKLWNFSTQYGDAVNDIPGAVTLFDSDEDSLVDRVYVGDMNGRLWELDAVDGTNPNGREGTGDNAKEVPLYNAGVGNPISVSPAIVKSGRQTILVFGTGGVYWASDAQTYAVYAVDAGDKQAAPTYAEGAGTLLWKMDLAAGEKVWSTPTIANGYIFLATAFGSMEGSDPRLDIPATGEASGNFYKLKLGKIEDDTRVVWKLTNIGKVRGSIYVDRQHAYMTAIDGQIIQIGGEDFAAGSGNNVSLRTWRQL